MPTAGSCWSAPEGGGARRARTGTAESVFFFSNRLGCLPSLMLSIVLTLILLFVTGVIR